VAERKRTKRFGVPSPAGFPADVQHLVNPIIGWLRLMEADGEALEPSSMASIIERLELVVELAEGEHERAKA
jgi:hypothetical protein